MTAELPEERFDSVFLGVAYKEFLALDLAKLKKDKVVVYDVNGILDEKD